MAAGAVYWSGQGYQVFRVIKMIGEGGGGGGGGGGLVKVEIQKGAFKKKAILHLRKSTFDFDFSI